jgi:hypothetical protein
LNLLFILIYLQVVRDISSVAAVSKEETTTNQVF